MSLQRHISILKIDTEGAEWRSISEMVKSGTIDDVKQLIVEFHVYLPQIRHASPSDYIAHLDLLRSLYEHGFRIYHFSMWLVSGKYAYESKGGIKRTGCHEVHFLKVV